jgi:hypothetical protein
LGGLRVFWTCIVTTVERNGTAIGPKVWFPQKGKLSCSCFTVV